jgi:outer membrane protein assembly factor BamC
MLMYNKKMNIIINFLISISFFLLISCSTDGTISAQAEYDQAEPRSSSELILPPGLTAPEYNATYKMLYLKSTPSGYQLNKFTDMNIVEEGSQRWLVIKNKNVSQVLPMVLGFLKDQHVNVKYENPNIGLVQTEWFDKNSTVTQGKMHEFLGWIGLVKEATRAPSWYNFRINLWQNGNDTEMFVTDYHVIETISAEGKNPTKNWVTIPANPQLELDFLLQFVNFVKFGGSMIEAVNQNNHEDNNYPIKISNRDKIVGNTLIIYDAFDQAWWRTGIALGRVGLGVADKNRSLGELYVYPLPEDVVNQDPGTFKRLFGDDKTNVAIPKPKYVIKLLSKGSETQLTFAMYPGATDSEFAENQRKYINNLAKQLK